MTHRVRGITLTELLVTLAIISLVVAAAGPPLERFLVRQTLVSEANRIKGVIQEARAEGAYRTQILVCSIEGRCEEFRRPATGLLLVADWNNNLRPDDATELLQEVSMPAGMTVQWRSFRNKPWLRINRHGVAYYQNGHFLLCYRGQARKVILNYQARTRLPREPADTRHCP